MSAMTMRALIILVNYEHLLRERVNKPAAHPQLVAKNRLLVYLPRLILCGRLDQGCWLKGSLRICQNTWLLFIGGIYTLRCSLLSLRLFSTAVFDAVVVVSVLECIVTIIAVVVCCRE